MGVLLLSARAIENQSYCIGVNRVGIDGNNLEYPGHSGVYDYSGAQQSFLGAKAITLTTRLRKQNIDFFRRKFPFQKRGGIPLNFFKFFFYLLNKRFIGIKKTNGYFLF